MKSTLKLKKVFEKIQRCNHENKYCYLNVSDLPRNSNDDSCGGYDEAKSLNRSYFVYIADAIMLSINAIMEIAEPFWGIFYLRKNLQLIYYAIMVSLTTPDLFLIPSSIIRCSQAKVVFYTNTSQNYRNNETFVFVYRYIMTYPVLYLSSLVVIDLTIVLCFWEILFNMSTVGFP